MVAPSVLGSDLVEQWRDLGPVLWLVAAGLLALWLVVLGLAAAWLDPRRVAAGAATLELPGPESPAVVNLLTTDWDLGHEAVPATLLDLAARRHLEIDSRGDDTWVRVRRHSETAGRERGRLTRYERMVLDHVADLATHTPDGTVPAAALTTGPEASASGWWSSFRSSVVDDARTRRLSRARWPAATKAVLLVLAGAVAVALALAVSTLRDLGDEPSGASSDSSDSSDDPVSAAIGAGIVGFAVLAGVAGSEAASATRPRGGRPRPGGSAFATCSATTRCSATNPRPPSPSGTGTWRTGRRSGWPTARSGPCPWAPRTSARPGARWAGGGGSSASATPG
jgi:hypothetical protein